MRAFSSLTARVFLLVTVGVLISAAVTLFLADRGRRALMEGLDAQRAADRIQSAVLMLDADPEARSRFLQSGRGLGMVLPPPALDPAALPTSAADTRLSRLLTEDLGPAFAPEAYDLDAARCGLPPPPPGAIIAPVCRLARVTLRDGTRLVLILPPNPPRQPREPGPGPGPDNIVFLGIFALFVAVLAFAGARLAVSPIRRFAHEAEELGKNIDRAPLPETGARETRQVAQALNTMQARVRGHLRERTSMLAAISHDLQTPLTRMRLRIEKLADEPLRDRLKADIAAMQSLIAQGLDLARGGAAEAPQPVRLSDLLDSACADAVEAGGDVAFEAPADITVTARPQALLRCVANLIDNAVKYGGSARVSAAREGARAIVRITDNGPGIAEAKLAEAFEPFVRLGRAGGQGVGLGLAIARTFARQNGGDLTLRNRVEGGLEAVLSLPCA